MLPSSADQAENAGGIMPRRAYAAIEFHSKAEKNNNTWPSSRSVNLLLSSLYSTGFNSGVWAEDQHGLMSAAMSSRITRHHRAAIRPVRWRCHQSSLPCIEEQVIRARDAEREPLALSSTIGQMDTSPAMTNGPYDLDGGFWVFPQAV